MKIYGTHVIKFVTIDTDRGEFRVSPNGIQVWNYDTMDYSDVNEWDLESGIYSELKRIAEEKLND